MKIKLALAIVIALLLPTAATANPAKSADNLNMVAGETFVLYYCAATARSSELTYRIDRSWIRLARSQPTRDSAVCKDRMQPIKHTFSFTVPMIYDSIQPTTKYARMLLRIIGPKHSPKLITATIFPTVAEKEAALGAVATNAGKTNWDKCLFQGMYLVGRVKVVSYDANFRVQLVNQRADLLVTESKGRPIQCGQWQFVNQNYDFTIQLVNESPDFTISIVRQKGRNR